MHITDSHAQLNPVYFREPNVNLGIGAARGKFPHRVGRNLLDTIPDESNPDPSVLLQDVDMQHKLDRLLDKLNDKQRTVVARRFGLRGQEIGTLEQVGNELGVTRERVRQIQIEALQRLKYILEREGYSVDNIL